ncbi:uncharacterized protein EDB91DRAFT_1335323 [Suillus paluster]|uniref:uncharacterized protein n=1 Tax=Suillus paluster TaxID=48578 RepID=UPI001B8817FE|nr:uncharacterized protein EDB91DRAFT_1335323 [Suillus paluster]KAG1745408.1 hypothetical protein EDB91DRAFT_1335323 [Suillus paluster]
MDSPRIALNGNEWTWRLRGLKACQLVMDSPCIALNGSKWTWRLRCKAGEKFNLSFASLTSREALQYLRDVQKNDLAGWARIATAQYKTDSIDQATDSESEDEATNAIGVESQGEHVRSDFRINADGGLSCANHSEVYDVGDIAAEDVEGGSNSVLKVEYGRGKCRRIANSMYDDFWSY